MGSSRAARLEQASRSQVHVAYPWNGRDWRCAGTQEQAGGIRYAASTGSKDSVDKTAGSEEAKRRLARRCPQEGNKKSSHSEAKLVRKKSQSAVRVRLWEAAALQTLVAGEEVLASGEGQVGTFAYWGLYCLRFRH